MYAKKCKVSSGEFILILHDEGTPLSNALLAIRLHIESKHHTELGQLTMVEEHKPRKKTEAFFFSTDSLIEDLLSSQIVTLEAFV